MLTIKNFDDGLPPGQIRKGRDYFDSGAVMELEEISDHFWQARVEGNEVYTVNVTLKGETIRDTNCDCPHEDEFCKHVIATLFALREEMDAKEISTSEKKSEKQRSKNDSFSGLLKQIKQDDLRRFVEDHAARNKEFRTQFMLHFADRLKEPGKEKYETLLRNIIRAAEESNGLFHYEGVQKMSHRIRLLLDEAERQLVSRNYLDPYHLFAAIVQQVYPVFFYADDSSGSLQGCMERTFMLLSDIQKSDAGYDLKEELFRWALNEAADPKYRNFGLDNNWLNLLLEGARDEEKKENVLNLLNSLMRDLPKIENGITTEYYQEQLLRKKMTLLELMGKEGEARNILESNLKIHSFRLQFIEEAIARNDFSKAKGILRESKQHDRQRGRFYGTLQWDELLLTIAQKEKDVKGIRNHALELFQYHYDLKYYRIIKSSYPEDEWPAEAEKIIEEIKSSRDFNFRDIEVSAAIFQEEQYWDRLLQLLQKNESLEFVEKYFELLKDRYPDELLDIYKEAIRRYAEHNMGNQHYEHVAEALRKIQSLPVGKEVAKLLAIEFKVKYRQRRNMVRELNKLVF